MHMSFQCMNNNQSPKILTRMQTSMHGCCCGRYLLAKTFSLYSIYQIVSSSFETVIDSLLQLCSIPKLELFYEMYNHL